MNFSFNKMLLSVLCIFTFPARSDMWIQPLYYADQEQLEGTLQAYSSNSGALLLGGDKQNSDNSKIGLGGSYFNVEQKYCNYPNMHVDVQNYQGFVYGALYFDRKIELDWRVSAGVNNYKHLTIQIYPHFLFPYDFLLIV